jgi:hypothetical protein
LSGSFKSSGKRKNPPLSAVAKRSQKTLLPPGVGSGLPVKDRFKVQGLRFKVNKNHMAYF